MPEHVRIERMAYGPDGIGKLEDGKTVFVASTVPGDLVSIEVTEDKPSYARAKVLELFEPSPHRIPFASPIDAYAGTADWQQIDYPLQLLAKRQNIVSALSHATSYSIDEAEELVQQTIPSKREWNYRNKLELACVKDSAGRLDVGFYKEGTHDFISIDSTKMVHKAIEKIPKALRGALRYAQGSGDLGLFRIGVRHSLVTNDLEVALWTQTGPFPRALVASTIASACKATGIVRVLATPGSARKTKGVEVLKGYSHWRERLGQFEYLTQARSFFQVNTAQAEKLIALTLEALGDVKGMYIADLYAGGGTFSVPIAAAGADVIAVESASSSVRDLRANADLNGVYVDVVGGDAAREIAELEDLDALVVDPPRAGLASNMPEAIAEAHPETIVYISCDPITWARDAELLRKQGYELQKATPVDMFPQTYHVETVSVFRAR